MSSYLDSPPTRGLVFLNVLLVLAFAVRLFLPDPEPAPPRSETKAPAQAISAPAAEPLPTASIESYPTIVERPLFIEARRAEDSQIVAGSTAPTGQASSIDDLSLSGVVLVGSRRIALIKAPGAAEALRVAEGDDLRGWKVLRVEREALVLSNNTEERTLAFPRPVQGVTTLTPSDAGGQTQIDTKTTH